MKEWKMNRSQCKVLTKIALQYMWVPVCVCVFAPHLPTIHFTSLQSTSSVSAFTSCFPVPPQQVVQPASVTCSATCLPRSSTPSALGPLPPLSCLPAPSPSSLFLRTSLWYNCYYFLCVCGHLYDSSLLELSLHVFKLQTQWTKVSYVSPSSNWTVCQYIRTVRYNAI